MIESTDLCSILAPITVTAAMITSTNIGTTVSRASDGTYFDKNGLLKTAAPNVLRVTYDPANLSAPPRVLIEAAATNLIPSSVVNAAYWTANGDASFNYGVAPDGSTTSTRIVGGTYYRPTSLNGGIYTHSEFVRPTGGVIILYKDGDGGSTSATFTISTGAVTLTGAATSSSITSVGGGWYRASMTMDLIAGNHNWHAFDYNATGSEFWGAQLEAGSVMTSYTPTTAAPVTRAADIISTTEDTNPAWDVGTTYPAGARRYVASTHRVYESAKDANTGKDPTVGANRFNAAGEITWWIEVGPTNLYAMFDGLVSTKTESTTNITITLKPGYFNGFALFGVEAENISFTVKDAPGGNVIRAYSGPLEGSAPSDYYEYFFEPFKPQTQFIETDIDPYNDMEITLALTSATATVKIGMFALGDLKPAGAPLRGASVEPTDYSYVSTDDFGNTVVKKRNNATGLNISAKMSIEDANSVLDTVKSFLGKPVVVIGSRAVLYEALTVFGLVSARLSYDDYGEPVINVTVKGLI